MLTCISYSRSWCSRVHLLLSILLIKLNTTSTETTEEWENNELEHIKLKGRQKERLHFRLNHRSHSWIAAFLTRVTQVHGCPSFPSRQRHEQGRDVIRKHMSKDSPREERKKRSWGKIQLIFLSWVNIGMSKKERGKRLSLLRRRGHTERGEGAEISVR